MKKIFTLALVVLLCSAWFAFADDALVLPARVGRFYLTNSYGFADGAYDTDGKYEAYDDGEGALKAYIMGFALEYGINDWISAAVQWAPGMTLWSEVDMNISSTEVMPGVVLDTGNDSELNVNDMYDIFVGAKLQIVGEKAPVPNSQVRFAVAPGFIIPTPGPDADTQLENLDNDDPVTIAPVDNHALAAGARFYFDYVINESIFANLYTEYIYYFETELESVAPGAPALGMPNSTSKADYNYGYKLTIEAEPHYETMVADGVELGIGVPITYVMRPDYEVEGDTVDDSGSTSLAIGPNVSAFLMKTPLPLEFKLGYSLPLYGTNGQATNSLTLQVKAYFQL